MNGPESNPPHLVHLLHTPSAAFLSDANIRLSYLADKLSLLSSRNNCSLSSSLSHLGPFSDSKFFPFLVSIRVYKICHLLYTAYLVCCKPPGGKSHNGAPKNSFCRIVSSLPLGMVNCEGFCAKWRIRLKRDTNGWIMKALDSLVKGFSFSPKSESRISLHLRQRMVSVSMKCGFKCSLNIKAVHLNLYGK